MTRRRVLTLGGAGLGVVALAAGGVVSDLIPGRTRLWAELGLNGRDGVVPSRTGTLVSGTFRSAARGVQVGWSIAYPPSAPVTAALPVVVALHGRHDDHASLFGDRIGLDHFLAASGLQLAVASVDGGDSYWHPRVSGEDAGAMVTDEFLPLLASRGLRIDRLGLYGYSMGGYGVLRLAGRLGAGRVAAVVAVSPALWTAAGDSAAGAFDGADDFAAMDVMGRQSSLDGVPLRLDCGEGDPFRRAVRTYRDGFRTGAAPSGGFQPGGHDEGYWRRMAPVELGFLGQHLSG